MAIVGITVRDASPASTYTSLMQGDGLAVRTNRLLNEAHNDLVIVRTHCTVPAAADRAGLKQREHELLSDTFQESLPYCEDSWPTLRVRLLFRTSSPSPPAGRAFSDVSVEAGFRKWHRNKIIPVAQVIGMVALVLWGAIPLLFLLVVGTSPPVLFISVTADASGLAHIQ